MRRRLVPLEVAAVGILLAACGSEAQPSASPSPDTSLIVRMVDAQGAEVAKAVLTPVPLSHGSSATGATNSGSPASTGVHFHVTVEKLQPGSHSFAVHAAGRCDPPGFTTAGPILNPSGARAVVGAQDLLGPLVGSLPDLPVGSDGSATVDFTSDAVTLDRGPANSLRSQDGTSLVVIDPAGNSRIACGVVSAPQPTSPTPSPSPTAVVSTSTTTTTVTVTHTSTLLATPSPTALPTATAVPTR